MQRALTHLTRTTTPLTTIQTRTLTSTRRRLAEKKKEDLSTDSSVSRDRYPDDKHTVNKAKSGDTHDVQTSNAKGGME